MNPSKLSEGMMRELIPLLETYDQTTACELVGITYTTLYNWRTRGKKDFQNEEDTIYARLFLRSQKARGQFKKPVVDSVRREALRGNPASQKMLLQAVDRKTWGDKIQVEQEIEKFMAKLKERLPDEVYQQVLDIATEE
jgi:hypothetical protein